MTGLKWHDAQTLFFLQGKNEREITVTIREDETRRTEWDRSKDSKDRSLVGWVGVAALGAEKAPHLIDSNIWPPFLSYSQIEKEGGIRFIPGPECLTQPRRCKHTTLPGNPTVLSTATQMSSDRIHATTKVSHRLSFSPSPRYLQLTAFLNFFIYFFPFLT